MTQTYEQRKRIRNVRWILFWTALMQTVATLAVNAVVSFLPQPSEEAAALQAYLQLGIIELLAFSIPILLYARTGWSASEQPPQKELRFLKFSPLAAVFTVLTAVGGQFVMVVLNIPPLLLLQQFGQSSGQTLPAVTHPRDLLLGILCVAVLPAFFEEFILRGFVFSIYEKHSTRAAVLFTTIMFVLLHGSLEEAPGLLLLGFMLTLVLIRTNSLWAAMLYHLVNNVTALLLGYGLPFVENPAVLVGIFAAGCMVFFAALVFFLKVTPKRKTVRSENDAKLLVQSFFSIPVLLSLGLEILLAVLTYQRI